MPRKTAAKKPSTGKPPVQQAFTASTYRNWGGLWSPSRITSAEVLSDSGNLREAAALCEQIIADDRVRGTLIESRIKGLLGLPLVFNSALPDVPLAECEADYYGTFPEAQLQEISTWSLLLGLGLAFVEWSLSPEDRLVGSLTIIHPSAVRYDISSKKWFVTQEDGSEVEADPNSPNWFFDAPYGLDRPWARGLWRSISRYWLAKQYANADWSRYGEKHGIGLFCASSDKDAISNDEDRKALANDLNQLGREKAIALPPGFQISLIEATASTWQTYQAQIAQVNEAIAIATLGQNLTTSVTSGSLAAASVHLAVKAQILSGDAESLSTCIHDQVLVHWATYNYGDTSLAPYPRYCTEAPEDVQALVTSWSVAATSLEGFGRLGLDVDLEAVARLIKLPLKNKA